jgi:hypothetical protein
MQVEKSNENVEDSSSTAVGNSAEYEFSAEDVVIDPYSCDLNLIVDKECLLAYPISSEGFCSMWAGCRATHGVYTGRVAFEVHASIWAELEFSKTKEH